MLAISKPNQQWSITWSFDDIPLLTFYSPAMHSLNKYPSLAAPRISFRPSLYDVPLVWPLFNLILLIAIAKLSPLLYRFCIFQIRRCRHPGITTLYQLSDDKWHHHSLEALECSGMLAIRFYLYDRGESKLIDFGRLRWWVILRELVHSSGEALSVEHSHNLLLANGIWFHRSTRKLQMADV